MGGCQSYGPFLGTLNIRCRIRTPKGTLIWTTTHMGILLVIIHASVLALQSFGSVLDPKKDKSLLQLGTLKGTSIRRTLHCGLGPGALEALSWGGWGLGFRFSG